MIPQAYAPELPAREVFSRFWPYARPFRGRLLVVIALGLLLPAGQAATIWLFKILIDRVLVPGDLGAFVPVAAGYAGITIAAGIVAFARSYLSRWLAQHFVLNLRTDLFAHLHHLSLDMLERRHIGDLVARLTSDARAIERLVVSGVTRSLGNILRVILFAGALLWLQWQLALIAFVVLPLFGLTAKIFSARIKTASRAARHYNGVMTAVAEESLSNAPLVQAYQRQDAEIDRFYRIGCRRLRARLAAARLEAGFAPLIQTLELVGILAVIGVGTWEIATGSLSLGGLLAFVGYLSGLFSPVRSLSRLANTIFSASAAAERISELFNTHAAVRPCPDARAIGRATGVVELDDVAFTYPGMTHPVLKQVSARVGPGQVLALTGPSGAGKSTIAKLITRLYDPSAGRVRLDGDDIRDLTLDSLRANIAVLLQETLVFHGTVFDNIAYGRPDASAEAVRVAARAADADGFIRAFPNGYDTSIGERGRKLSGGQRQRIAIARALIRDAPVLILDEPAAGLDAETQARIREPLRRLMAGCTTIVIAHDPCTIERADMVLHLDDRGAAQSMRSANGGVV